MRTIDVTKDHCPMTFVKVKIALEELALGEKLDVLLTPGEPLENIPKSGRSGGEPHRRNQGENGNYHVVIEKRGFIQAGCGCRWGVQNKPA